MQDYLRDNSRLSPRRKKSFVDVDRLRAEDYKQYGAFKFYKPIVCFEIFCFVIFLAMAVTIVITFGLQTLSRDKDQYQAVSTSKTYEELNEVDFNDQFKMMPFLELKVSGAQDPEVQQLLVNHNPNESNVWNMHHIFKLDKLAKYFKVQFVQNVRKDRKSILYTSDLVPCKKEFFTDRNYPVEDEESIRHFLCPDIDSLKEHFRLQNAYNDHKLRKSFSIEFIDCQRREDGQDDCKSKDEQEEMMKKIMATVYILKQKPHFLDENNLMKNPLVSEIEFFQQFVLSNKVYRDNNNFVRTNRIQTKDFRYINFIHQDEFEFVDVIQKIPFTTDPLISDFQVSEDFGETDKIQQRKMFVGMFFFLSSEVVEYERQVYGFENYLSDVGGLLGLIFAFLPFLYSITTQKFRLAQIIKFVFSKRMVSNKGNIQKILVSQKNEYLTKKFQTAVSTQKKQTQPRNSVQLQLFNDPEESQIQENQESRLSDNYKGSENVSQNDISLNSQNASQNDISINSKNIRSTFKVDNKKIQSILDKMEQVKRKSESKKKKDEDENIFCEVNKIYEFEQKELEFNLLDIICSYTIMKPFKPLLKKANLLKNIENFSKLGDLLLTDNQIQNRMLRSQQVKKLVLDINVIVENLNNLNLLIDYILKRNKYLLNNSPSDFKKSSKFFKSKAKNTGIENNSDEELATPKSNFIEINEWAHSIKKKT